MNNICNDCGAVFDCDGDELAATGGFLICTHERCQTCQNTYIFSHGIAFPNTVAIQVGIAASYHSPPITEPGLQTRMDIEGDDFIHINELNDTIDSLTNEPYGTPREARRRQYRE